MAVSSSSIRWRDAGLLGMAKVKGYMKMLLDLDRVLGDADMANHAIAIVQ